MPDFMYERQMGANGLIFGVDEAGRGPWCGPVVAACVCWPDLNIPDEIRQTVDDSKKLTAKRREKLFDLIYASSALIGVGQASAAEIDAYNILQATFLAMSRALDDVRGKGHIPAAVLIDGNRAPKNWTMPCQTVIGGDAKSLSIAAASVIAKVTRDRIMCELAARYPAYGWDKNAGYGTPAHMRALHAYGVTPHHRKSYSPVAKILGESAILQQQA